MKKAVAFIIVCAASAFAYNVNLGVADVYVAPAEGDLYAGYDTVQIKGGGMLPVAAGQPSLPSVVVNLALPPGTVIDEVEVSPGEPRELPGTYKLLPHQGPLPVGTAPMHFIPGKAEVYGSDRSFPGNLVWSHVSSNVSGYALGSIVFAPVQYLPATGKVLVYENVRFDVRVKHAEGEQLYPRYRLDWINRDLRASLASEVINPGDLRAAAGTRLVMAGERLDADTYPYLIITNDTLAATAQTLADWKTRKGLRATVVTLTTISSNYAGADLAEKIRNCIGDYYYNNATQYVLLVGTSAIVPVRKVYDAGYDVSEGDHLVPTDNYYGCLDGNFNADGDGYWGEYPSDNPDFGYDVYVGRVQVSDATTLAKVIDKTLCYEGSTLSSETNPYTYQRGAILAGSFLDSSTNERYLMEYVRDNCLASTPGWSLTQLWDTTYPGGSVFSSTAFVTAMNAGPGLIAHAAHSNSTIIGTNSGSVSSTQLYNLSNHPKYAGVLYTLGCYDGNTDVTNNCSAYFVNAPLGGGVGFVGNNRYGWYSPGNPADGFSADFLKQYFTQMVPNDVYVAGQTLALHKHALQANVTDTIYRYIYFELYLNGDPDIWVPTGSIGTPTVDHLANIPTGSQNYDVMVVNGATPLEGALVCVWKGTEVYAAALTSSDGKASFEIEPTTSGTMYLTVSAHNYKTYSADIGVGTSGIVISDFSGRRIPEGIKLSWRLGSGGFNGYFNVYRRPRDKTAATADGGLVARDAVAEGAWKKINATPITGRNPYVYVDRGAAADGCVYKLEAVEDLTAVEVGRTTLPSAAKLAFGLTAAPNPARERTTFHVGVPSAGNVALVVYDVTGRKVSTVVDRSLAAGEYDLRMDVSGLPAGIYLARLDAAGQTKCVRVAVAH